MDRYTHVHVYGSSEPECTSGRKEPRLEERGGGGEVVGGDKKFSVLFKGEQKIFNGEQIFFDIHFQFQEPLSGGKKWCFP